MGGAAASFALSQFRAGAAEAESRVHPLVLAASSATSDPLLPSLAAEHQALRSRVAQLEAHAAASAAPSATSAESSPAREPNPDPEVHRAELRAERDASEKAHSEEARDPAWSARQDSVMTEALKPRQTTGGFSMLRVDCRTTLCRAELEWPSFESAQKKYSEALALPVPGCTSQILLDPPANPDLPYRAAAMYDCTENRTSLQ